MSYQPHQQSEPPVPILLLKEGTRETKKKDAQSSNISAAKMVAEILHKIRKYQQQRHEPT
jgi:hypothetical protein